MKKIALITTGGTIASKKDRDGLLTCTEMKGDELAKLCELPSDITLEVHNLFQLPSMHLSFNMLIILKNKVGKLFQDKSVDGIVITHGTDSLEETSYFLDLTVGDRRPVVVTGSQRSTESIGSDALINLRHSISVASENKLDNIGTIVVFNERIWSSRYVKKVDASNLQGFNAFGFGYLGVIDNGVVNLFQRPLIREFYDINDELPPVDIIKSYIDADGKFINAAIQNNIKGIILEGSGGGQVSPLMMDEVSRAVKKGIKIVITTSSEEGKVGFSYNDKGSAIDLYNQGVISGFDYDSKKARIKLAVLLSANEENIESEFLK
ncbi:L-asparaginase [Lentibacillus kapialis]|uniref:asparaginase n=1 Tax=Lentibacillus kapialis TaxID=340214 RepID=A0A917V0X1_9BACI|nr:asparaginase [Lentibacillus kapialis]GGK05835.1 L-asparaginase [Lentibacillus kapialis]